MCPRFAFHPPPPSPCSSKGHAPISALGSRSHASACHCRRRTSFARERWWGGTGEADETASVRGEQARPWVATHVADQRVQVDTRAPGEIPQLPRPPRRSRTALGVGRLPGAGGGGGGGGGDQHSLIVAQPRAVARGRCPPLSQGHHAPVSALGGPVGRHGRSPGLTRARMGGGAWQGRAAGGRRGGRRNKQTQDGGAGGLT